MLIFQVFNKVFNVSLKGNSFLEVKKENFFSDVFNFFYKTLKWHITPGNFQVDVWLQIIFCGSRTLNLKILTTLEADIFICQEKGKACLYKTGPNSPQCMLNLLKLRYISAYIAMFRKHQMCSVQNHGWKMMKSKWENILDELEYCCKCVASSTERCCLVILHRHLIQNHSKQNCFFMAGMLDWKIDNGT